MRRLAVAFACIAVCANAQTPELQRIESLELEADGSGNRTLCWNTNGTWIGSDPGSCTCNVTGEVFDPLPGGLGCVVSAPPEPVCGDGAIEPPEVCEAGDFGGETCASILGVGYTGTLSCNTIIPNECRKIITTGCTAPPPPPPPGVWDALAPHVPPAGEWALIPNSSPTVFHQENEFPHSADVWGRLGPTGAWTAWTGLALDRARARWIQAAGGGHSAYGGNEVYVYDFATNSWSRETDPSERVHDDEFSCDVPVSGPVSRHHYDGILYVPSTDDVLVAGSAGYCRPRTPGGGPGEGPDTNQNRIWAYSIPQKAWRLLPSLAGLEGINGSAYDAARDRVYLGRGRDSAANRFRELDPQNDYAIVQDHPMTKQFDGSMEFDRATRILWSVGTSGQPAVDPQTTIVKIPIALDGTLGTVTTFNLSSALPSAPRQSRSLAIHSPSGDLVIWHENNVVTRVASTLDSAETYFGGGPVAPVSSTNIYSKWFYLEQLDVFVGMHEPSEGVWLYRLPASGGSASTFEQLCAQPGVVLCDPLDSEGPFDGKGVVLRNPDGTQGVPVNRRTGNWRGVEGTRKPAIDYAVKASGSGSMRFTVASESDGNDMGDFATNFSPDLSVHFKRGDTVYTHIKIRLSCELLYLDCDPGSPNYKTDRREYRSTKSDGARMKLFIIGTGDVDPRFPARSCSSLEVVLNHGPDHHLAGYHHCGTNEHFTERIAGTSDFEYQPNGAFSCQSRPNGARRAWGNTGPDCFYLEPEWMTFETKIEIGKWQPRGAQDGEKLSRITVWAAHEGEPLQVVMQNDFYLHGPNASDFARDQDFTASAGYGKIWPHPFINAKDPTEIHPEARIWYDELIISTEPIRSEA